MLALESSLRPFPIALEGPDRSKLTSSACPGHLAAFASKCLRNQCEAAVDPGVKGTYTCSFETVLAGMFCTTNSLGNGVFISLLNSEGVGEKPSVHFDPGKESHCSEPEKGVPEGPTAASHALLKRPLLLLSARNPSNCPPAPLRKVIKAVSIK